MSRISVVESSEVQMSRLQKFSCPKFRCQQSSIVNKIQLSTKFSFPKFRYPEFQCRKLRSSDVQTSEVQLSTKFSFPKFRCHFSCRNSKAQTPAVQFSKSSVIQSSVVKCSVVFLSVGKMLWRQKRRSDKSSCPKRLQMRCYHLLRFFEWKTFLVNKTTSF